MSQFKSSKQWICFQIAEETYAQRVIDVQEVFDYKVPVPIPGAPSGVVGVLNIRGEIVTIISARNVLNINTFKSEENDKIMVIQTRTGPIGLIVDQVWQIETIEDNSIESTDSEAHNPITGTVLHQNNLIILTDFNRYVSQFTSHE